MEKQSESALLYAIMREIGKFGAVFRCNSGAVKLPSGKYFRGMPKGFADLMLIRADGGVCFVECKADGGKLTDEQARFLDRMRGLNCRAGVARSVREAMEICELCGGANGDK